MREIKFRAFIKNLGQIADVLSIDFVNSEVEVYLDEIRKYHFDEVDLLLATGEFDSNGKEIYVGDIVRGKYGKNGFVKNYEIRWLRGNFIVVDIDTMTGKERYYPLGLLDGEVIGNKYTNPELLEANGNEHL